MTEPERDNGDVVARVEKSHRRRYLPWIRSIAWSERIFGVEAREAR